MTDRYISPTGDDDTGSGTEGSPWLTLNKAIPYLNAGETLYCRGGTYTKVDDMAATAAGGTAWTAGNFITVTNYPTETPVFGTRADPTDLGYTHVFSITHAYWIFDGLQFIATDTTSRGSGTERVASSKTQVWHTNANGHHTIVRNCVVQSADLEYGKWTWNSMIFAESSNNEFYSNIFDKCGETYDTNGLTIGPEGYMIHMWGSYNKVHHNTLSRAAHDCLSVYSGSYNEIYNNTMTHVWGYGVYIAYGATYNLAQDNNITGCNEAPILYVKMPIYNKGSNNIIRRNAGWNSVNAGGGFTQDNATASNNHIYNNVFYNNADVGMHFAFAGATATGNKIYNNVIAKNGSVQDQPYNNKEVSSISPQPSNYFDNAWSNEFKNNYIVAYQSGEWKNDWASVFIWLSPYQERAVSYMEANYAGWANNIYNYSDPLFVDPDTGDFTIQSGSPLIDAGRHLTTTDGTGDSSTELIVHDALFFWTGDVLQTFGTISSIDYDTNTITLSSPASWEDGDNVDLVYYGSAPDIGVFEIQEETTTTTTTTTTSTTTTTTTTSTTTSTTTTTTTTSSSTTSTTTSTTTTTTTTSTSTTSTTTSSTTSTTTTSTTTSTTTTTTTRIMIETFYFVIASP